MMQLSSFQRRCITVTVMLVAVVEVLDMTIVTVSLPSMMGSLGANTEQITWVLTSYIVSAAILMPLTGFLVQRLGRKRLLLINIIGFLVASALCGLALNLSQMVLFRTAQGLFGASLVPLAQYILRDAYPREQHGKAMAIWGIGIMAGPVLGPTLGGYITEWFSWRWIFYLNLPVCLFAWLMALKFIPETPTEKKHIDWLGVILLSGGIGALQIFLDKGNSVGWLNDKGMQILLITWVLALSSFVFRGLKRTDTIINLRLFANKNFLLSQLLLMTFCASVLSVISLQPVFFQQFMGYPTIDSGVLMAPRGIASAVGMMIAARFLNTVDARLLVGAGLLTCSFSTYLTSGFAPFTPSGTIMLYSALQGIGMGLFFVPLSTFAFATLPDKHIAEASGLFSFCRSLGNSIGISLMGTFISRSSQVHWQQLASNVTNNSQALEPWLSALGKQQLDGQSAALISHELAKQAGSLSFINSYWIAAFVLLTVIPLLLFIEVGEKKSTLGAH